jgi:hypothetical protein
MYHEHEKKSVAPIEEVGVVDENQYLPVDAGAQAVTPDTPVEVTPEGEIPVGFKRVSLLVPEAIEETMLQTAIQLGQAAYAACLLNKATMIYPALVKNGQGQVGRAVGKSECLLSTKGLQHADNDVKLLLDLFTTIHGANVAFKNAVKPMDKLDADVRGKHAKENASRDVKAKAKGEAGGIIIP